jgi:hypothetical protein
MLGYTALAKGCPAFVVQLFLTQTLRPRRDSHFQFIGGKSRLGLNEIFTRLRWGLSRLEREPLLCIVACSALF